MASRFTLFPVEELIMASVVVMSLLGWASKSVKRALILTPYRVRANGEVHRLLTGAWLHADLTHLLVNMVSLYFFAGPSIQALGAVRFAILYVSAAVVAFIPSAIRYMNKPRYATLGASGAVSAVMFSAILLHPTRKVQFLFFPFPIPAAIFGVGYLAYSVWHAYGDPDNVNHDAHFTGALYGALFTYLLEPEAVTSGIRLLLH